MLKTDWNVHDRNSIAGALRPLDENQRFLGHDLVPSEVRQLVRLFEPIQIEMKDRGSRRFISMHDREGRTRDVLSHAIAATDRLHERRLSRAKIARDRHDHGRGRDASETPAPLAKLVFSD